MATNSGLTPDQLKALNDEIERGVKALEREARLREQVSSSIDGYVQGLKDSRKAQETLNVLAEREKKIQKELADAQSSNDDDALKAAQLKLEVLKRQTAEIKKQKGELDDALASVNKAALVSNKAASSAIKGLVGTAANLDKIFINVFNRIKNSGLFEIDKEMKKAALSIGILSKGTAGFESSIKGAATRTTMIGSSIKELSQAYALYSGELGRAVELSENGLVAMGQMIAATGLGVEGTGKMVADMDNIGLSAERTGEFMDDTMNSASRAGLNAQKVVKNIAGSMKMLNRYNFKNGVEGLATMAKTVSKLGVSMEFASGMADKLFDVEGAVQMSAQLQVMGGAWANMADPFRLMYLARNDINGLTEELGNAAASSAKFNERTKEFELGAMEMHKLKIIAEQTGVAYDDLVTAGKNAAKYAKIKSQISFSVGGGKDGEDLKDYLTSKSFFNKDGKASIMLNGAPKLVSQLTTADSGLLRAQMAQQQSMQERAMQSQEFDEQITNLINELKIYMLPLVDTMNKTLIPKIGELVKKFTEGGWGEKLSSLAETVGTLISGIAGFVIDNPITSALILGAAKFTGFLFEKASWILNGIALARGFLMGGGGAGGAGGAGGPGGGMGSLFGGKGKMGRLRSASKIGKFAKGWGGAGAGLLAAGVSGYDEWSENSANGVGAGENAGRTGVRAAAAGGGAWGGAALGATIGTMIFPGVGTAIGGLIGGIAGGLAGDKLGDAGGNAIWGDDSTRGRRSSSVNDGFFRGKPIHDGYSAGEQLGRNYAKTLNKGLGPDFNDNRALIQNGAITPIDNKDDLMALKPGGIVDNAMNSGGSNIVKHEFGDLNINGSLTVSSPGNPGADIDVMKDPEFRRTITKIITTELEKNKNGGKNKGY